MTIYSAAGIAGRNMIEEIAVQSKRRVQFINIDKKIGEFVHKSGVNNGLLTLFVPHTTAAITINENADPNVIKDITAELEKVIPYKNNYQHYEGNSDAHIKSSLLGPGENLIVSEGKLLLGTWQSVFFCEFDGPRARRVICRIE